MEKGGGGKEAGEEEGRRGRLCHGFGRGRDGRPEISSPRSLLKVGAYALHYN